MNILQPDPARLVGRRERMVEDQLARRGIGEPMVLEAFRRVPREAFVPENLRESAYDDAPLAIGEGQTISQPYVVALMIAAAGLHPGDRVLDVGTGSGYAAAVMSLLAAKVYTIERHAALAAPARQRFGELGYGNIDVRLGDGTEGWPEAAPFNAILVAASGPRVPQPLREQLAPGGRLVMPVDRAPRRQTLVCLTRKSEIVFEEKDLCPVSFVPLIGTHGWTEPPAGAF